ncbi:MAG: HipA domain-containing protein, partial [Nannocystaceae bacterium]
MGSKEKFWYREAQTSWLFKFCRPGTGEDWAEKLAASIAALLNLPHAIVELAEYDGRRGSSCKRFTDGQTTLLHGNDVLLDHDPRYPNQQRYRVSAHTLEAIFHALSRFEVEPPANLGNHLTATDVFVGYIMLDALIGNTDRHHENWGLLRRRAHNRYVYELAPTYDHASSLGRELRETSRAQRLATRDRNRTPEAYADRARSALYASVNSPRPLSTFDAFASAAQLLPNAAEYWLARLEAITSPQLLAPIQRVPATHMQDSA